jgi:hypothetical protein
MNRRDLLRSALAGAGAIPGAAQTPARSPAWKPALLDDHQNRTVTALAEQIIPATDTPGAAAARVNEYIDLILADGPPQRRARFLEGLGWLDGHSIRLHQRPFADLASAERAAILAALDAGASSELAPGVAFFRMMKGLTVEGYYTSRIGIEELNKGGRVPSTAGCTKTGDHAGH